MRALLLLSWSGCSPPVEAPVGPPDDGGTPTETAPPEAPTSDDGGYEVEYGGRIRVLSGARLAAEGLGATWFERRAADGDSMSVVGLLGDVDGDARGDLLLHAGNRPRLLLGADVAADSAPPPLDLPIVLANGGSLYPVGDVTGDGVVDAASFGGSPVPTFYSGAGLADGEAPVAAFVAGPTEALPYGTAGDVNGDGVGDLATLRTYPPGELLDFAVFYGPLAGDLDPEAPDVVLDVEVQGVGDVDGDGRGDLAGFWPGPFGSDNELLVFPAASDAPTWAEADAAWRITGETGNSTLFPAGDLDGDGRAELWVSQMTVDGYDRLEVFAGGDLDGRVYGAADLTVPGLIRQRPALGDFDADGQLDLAVTPIVYGGPETVEIYFAPGLDGGTLGAADVTLVLPSPGIVWVAGDLDGDGVDDLVIDEPNALASDP